MNAYGAQLGDKVTIRGALPRHEVLHGALRQQGSTFSVQRSSRKLISMQLKCKSLTVTLRVVDNL